jgi:hypothetical protein
MNGNTEENLTSMLLVRNADIKCEYQDQRKGRKKTPLVEGRTNQKGRNNTQLYNGKVSIFPIVEYSEHSKENFK